MKLDTSNELAEAILTKAKAHQEYADMYARQYADNDNPHDQAMYRRYVAMDVELREIHKIVCAYLHKIEAELIKN